MGCPATASQISSLQWRTPFSADAGIRHWNASSSQIGTSHSDQLADSVIPCCHLASIHCALSGTDCSHCECFNLASLRSRIAFFSESDSAPRALPFSSSQVQQWGRGFEQPVTSELTSAQCPCAIYGSSRAHYSPQVSDRCDSRQNKTHTFLKREQKYCSAYHKHPALMQPVCTTVSTPCHVGRSLAGHPWCVRVGNDYCKTRLYTPIRSKTTALPQCARNHSAQRGCPSPPCRGD